MWARHRQDGSYCCECDYCYKSPCNEKSKIYSIFLTDHTKTGNYYLFCDEHRDIAEQQVHEYLANNPDVEIDPNE